MHIFKGSPARKAGAQNVDLLVDYSFLEKQVLSQLNQTNDFADAVNESWYVRPNVFGIVVVRTLRYSAHFFSARHVQTLGTEFFLVHRELEE